MSDAASREETLENIFATNYRGHLATNVSLRWQMYEHAEQPDVQMEVIDQFVQPGDSIVDIGCGRGKILLDLAAQARHASSRFIAIDRDSSSLKLVQKQAAKLGNLPVQLVCAKAEQVPLQDDSVDVSVSMFVLYHVVDIDTSLREMCRVTKQEGSIIIGTSSRRNKSRMRIFEDRIADHLGVSRPPRLTRTFTTDQAPEYIDSHMELVAEPFVWSSELRIQSTNPHDPVMAAYLDSLATMKQYFHPHVTWQDMRRSFYAVCAPEIDDEIARQGYFSEPLERVYYVCAPR